MNQDYIYKVATPSQPMKPGSMDDGADVQELLHATIQGAPHSRLVMGAQGAMVTAGGYFFDFADETRQRIGIIWVDGDMSLANRRVFAALPGENWGDLLARYTEHQRLRSIDTKEGA